VRGLGLVACLFRVRGTRVIFKTFESLLILILTTGYLYKDESSCMISLHDIMLINVLIAKGMYLEV
jgi:hypothetical protein